MKTAPVRTTQGCVLVVDDEMLIRMVIADVLRDEGLTVIEAVSGDEAYGLLLAGVAVDLLITDVRMPGALDGFALAAAARAMRPGLPILVGSANIDAGALASGAGVAFLAKPYTNDKLLATTRALLAARS